MKKNRKRNRLKAYDYSQPGHYFVTICTKNRDNWFGEVNDGKMILNECGVIAAGYWSQIQTHYGNATLDEWVVMPNHIHGIIVILAVGTEQCSVPTHVKSVSLSQIVKSFKDITIKRIRSEFGNSRFAWQRSFHDHVIRDELELRRIREYIVCNPAQWAEDENHPANLPPPEPPRRRIGFRAD